MLGPPPRRFFVSSVLAVATDSLSVHVSRNAGRVWVCGREGAMQMTHNRFAFVEAPPLPRTTATSRPGEGQCDLLMSASRPLLNRLIVAFCACHYSLLSVVCPSNSSSLQSLLPPPLSHPPSSPSSIIATDVATLKQSESEGAERPTVRTDIVRTSVGVDDGASSLPPSLYTPRDVWFSSTVDAPGPLSLDPTDEIATALPPLQPSPSSKGDFIPAAPPTAVPTAPP